LTIPKYKSTRLNHKSTNRLISRFITCTSLVHLSASSLKLVTPPPDHVFFSNEYETLKIRTICNTNTSEGFNLQKDVTLPEVNLPNGRLSVPPTDQSPSRRMILTFSAGGSHGYIRKILLENWKQKDQEIVVHEYLPKGLTYDEFMSKAKFCLCPRGYEVASLQIIEAIFYGCVPVITSVDYPLPFSDMLDWGKFSV